MRDRVIACALAAGLLVLLTGPPAGAQPVATLGEWSVLALDGGLFFVRNDQDAVDVDFVYAYTANSKGELRAVSAEDGSDLKLSIESLAKTVSLSDKDLETLKAFTDTQSLPSDGKGAGWKAASYDEISQLLEQSDVSLFVDVMVQTLAARWSGNAGALAVEGGYCKAGTFIDAIAAANESAANQVVAASSMTFGQAIAATCADIFDPWPPTAPPAWPIYIPPATPPPGWTPPTGPGAPVWVGGPCTNHGMTAQCVDQTGQLCTCSCEGAGNPGIWQRRGGCTTIPSNPPGSACNPAGGLGPCGNKCSCNCVAPPATGGPPGSGTWASPPVYCAGSEEAAYGLLAATALCGVWFARRSRRTAAGR